MPKQFSVEINTAVRSEVSLEGEATRAGMSRRKGWFHRFKVGTEPQRGRLGRLAVVSRVMKRVGFGDWYSEKIIDKETGQVLHERNEPLSAHQGHGSAKTKPAVG